MKILCWMVLHYGKPFLRDAIQAVYDDVDEIHIYYTPTPNYTAPHPMLPCPDDFESLKPCFEKFLPKLRFHVEGWHGEEAHCNAWREHAKGFDWAWRIDSDEITPPGFLSEMIGQATGTPFERFGVPFVHFWRSFNRVCVDAARPIRLFQMGGQGEARIESDKNLAMLHMGYAQPTPYIYYKQYVSSHAHEWRKDWFDMKWLLNAQEDIHPVVKGYWSTRVFDKTALPQILKDHPYYYQDLI